MRISPTTRAVVRTGPPERLRRSFPPPGLAVVDLALGLCAPGLGAGPVRDRREYRRFVGGRDRWDQRCLVAVRDRRDNRGVVRADRRNHRGQVGIGMPSARPPVRRDPGGHGIAVAYCNEVDPSYGLHRHVGLRSHRIAESERIHGLAEDAHGGGRVECTLHRCRISDGGDDERRRVNATLQKQRVTDTAYRAGRNHPYPHNRHSLRATGPECVDDGLNILLVNH